MQPLSRMSLTRRLTLMFVAATTTVLLLLGFVVARSVEQHFEDLDMMVLSGKMELIQQGLSGSIGTCAAGAYATHLHLVGCRTGDAGKYFGVGSYGSARPTGSTHNAIPNCIGGSLAYGCPSNGSSGGGNATNGYICWYAATG